MANMQPEEGGASRPTTLVATSAAPGGKKGKNSAARVLGSACAGISELLLFHPVDTVAKRLMSNHTRVVGSSTRETAAALNKVIFKQAAEYSTFRRYLSLFPGLGYGAGYKVLQRVYKFGGQPFVNEHLQQHHTDTFRRLFGEKQAKTMMYATAGSIMGVGEIVLLPLDVLKIKAQTNPESIANRSIFDIFAKEGWGLYRGAGWTAARNAPGSFALFGGSAFVKSTVFGLQNYGDATWTQDFFASMGGAISSIAVAQPLDVIKTRIQNKSFDSPQSGRQILADLLKNEGPGALFKGLAPKLIVVGPKLIFSFTVAQHLIARFEKTFA